MRNSREVKTALVHAKQMCTESTPDSIILDVAKGILHNENKHKDAASILATVYYAEHYRDFEFITYDWLKAIGGISPENPDLYFPVTFRVSPDDQMVVSIRPHGLDPTYVVAIRNNNLYFTMSYQNEFIRLLLALGHEV